MDRDKLIEEIARIIETENAYGYYAPDRAVELADSILSLLDAQRCEWKDDGYGDYAAQCGGYFSFDHDIVDDKYCPHCGRRIEVKDGQG